jgi:hypothetical protein
VALSGTSGEPASGGLNPDVVAALSHLAEVIDQGLQFGSLGGERASPWRAELRVWSLVDMPQYRTGVRQMSRNCVPVTPRLIVLGLTAWKASP